MEDLKQIQEFFSKPLNENAFVEAFKLEKALKGMGYNVKVKYLDDFGKDVFEIYFQNPADADDSIFYDAKELGYDNVRVFANPQESLDEAYIVTYAKNKGEKPASVAYKLRGSALAFMRDLEKDGYTTMLTQRPVDGVDEVLDEYNSGIYFDPDKATQRNKAKEVSKTALDKVRDAIKKVMTGDYEPTVTENETDMEIKVGDYQTQYFHMCPGAVAVYQDIEDKVEDMGLAIRSAKLQDALFAMEKSALESGATEAEVFAAQSIADQIMAMAAMMGLDKEHSYIQGHVEKIKGALNEITEAKVEVDDTTEFKLDLRHLLDKHAIKETIKFMENK